eukprot:scaffold7259_cov544-Prasinococcus_capsulatus_cf.AAC.3
MCRALQSATRSLLQAGRQRYVPLQLQAYPEHGAEQEGVDVSTSRRLPWGEAVTVKEDLVDGVHGSQGGHVGGAALTRFLLQHTGHLRRQRVKLGHAFHQQLHRHPVRLPVGVHQVHVRESRAPQVLQPTATLNRLCARDRQRRAS